MYSLNGYKNEHMMSFDPEIVYQENCYKCIELSTAMWYTV